MRINPDFYIALALALLLLPLQWVIGWLLAASVHELFHYAVLRLLHVRVAGMILSMGGAKMQTGPMCPAETFAASLAGPAGSLLLGLLRPWFPVTAVCALIQGLFNLLPVMPLDGGRAAQALLCSLFPNGTRYAVLLEWGTVGLFGAGCLYFGWKTGCFSESLMAFGLFLWKTGKIPCKLRRQRVQ